MNKTHGVNCVILYKNTKQIFNNIPLEKHGALCITKEVFVFNSVSEWVAFSYQNTDIAQIG